MRRGAGPGGVDPSRFAALNPTDRLRVTGVPGISRAPAEGSFDLAAAIRKLASVRTEAAALRQLENFGAEVTSTVTLATSLAPDFTTPLGQQMFAVLQQLRVA